MAKTIGAHSIQLLHELLNEKKILLTDQRLRDSNCVGRLANAGLAVLDRAQQAYIPTPEGEKYFTEQRREGTLPEVGQGHDPHFAQPGRVTGAQ